MIYTKIEELKKYYNIHKNLDIAIDFILNNDLKGLENGKNNIDEDKVFVNKFEYYTIDKDDIPFESHYKYLDIHIVMKNEEYVAVSDVSKLVKTKDILEDDASLYSGQEEDMIRLDDSNCLILFFEDGHKPKIRVDESSLVSKLVFKVLYD